MANRKVIPPGSVGPAQTQPTDKIPGHEKIASRWTFSSFGPPYDTHPGGRSIAIRVLVCATYSIDHCLLTRFCCGCSPCPDSIDGRCTAPLARMSIDPKFIEAATGVLFFSSFSLFRKMRPLFPLASEDSPQYPSYRCKRCLGLMTRKFCGCSYVRPEERLAPVCEHSPWSLVLLKIRNSFFPISGPPEGICKSTRGYVFPF